MPQRSEITADSYKNAMRASSAEVSGFVSCKLQAPGGLLSKLRQHLLPKAAHVQ